MYLCLSSMDRAQLNEMFDATNGKRKSFIDNQLPGFVYTSNLLYPQHPMSVNENGSIYNTIKYKNKFYFTNWHRYLNMHRGTKRATYNITKKNKKNYAFHIRAY